jgi:tRNA1(Val) A37 N6-methylase TrmN6
VNELDYSQYATDVQAILVNPPWDCTHPISCQNNDNSKLSKSKNTNGISIEEFCRSFKVPTTVMKDGLLFIWVEKEIIADLIKCFEDQDFFYVENVCYIMLDQNKKQGKYLYFQFFTN